MRTTVPCLIGIDISTKKIAIARVVLHTDLPWPARPTRTVEVKVKGQRAEDRLIDLLIAFKAAISDLRPVDFAYVEDISFIPKGELRRSELDLAKVLGGVRFILAEFEIPHALVNNACWKAGIGLGGRAKKPAILAHAADFWGVTPESQDTADALGILEWGTQHFDG